MSRDRNFQRRMIVSKYSNRPPFELKKPKESYDIEDKIKEYPEETCVNCCGNRSGTIREIPRPSKSLPPEDLETEPRVPPGKRVIPKIIETFQRVTPAVDTSETPTMSKNTSIQTLYRNTKSCKLGKNIPTHKLMKSLLQNLEPEPEKCKKSLSDFATNKNKGNPVKGRVKYKKSRKQFFDKDEVVRPDFSVTFDLKTNTQEENTGTCCNMPQKVDKRTSTTGLVWPPKPREVPQYASVKFPRDYPVNRRSSHSCHCGKMGGRSSFGTVKEEHRKGEVSEFTSESFLEEVPTKDVPQTQTCYIEPRGTENMFRSRKNEVDSHYRQRTYEIPKTTTKHNPKNSNTNFKTERKPDGYAKSSTEKMKPREKTFVQTQVEKLNKVMRNTKIPGPKFPNHISGSQRKDVGFRHPQNTERRGREDASNRKEAIANYLGLMDRIRNNCPQLHSSKNCQNFESDHEWSDTSEAAIVPEQIRFPKETKTAIDQRLYENKPRIPLSKFTKIHENCRPAMPANSVKDTEYFEGYDDMHEYDHFTRGKEKQTRSRDVRKSGPVQNRPKLNVPCKKNLLCDKGDHHSGPCGYTHNHNKVIY